MKSTILNIIGAISLLFTSCSQQEEPIEAHTQPVTISVTDSGFSSMSRASESGYATEFTAGDVCGLYVVRNGHIASDNIRLVASQGENGQTVWTPDTPIYGGLQDESFFLYYPYQEDMAGKTNPSSDAGDDFFAPLVASWAVKADQSTYADYTASDLMTAKGIVNVTADGKLNLSFTMSHRMALAVIEMPKTVYKFTDTSIPDYTGGTSADFTDSDIQPYAIAPGTYRCIVNPRVAPKSINASYSNGINHFVITLDVSPNRHKTYKVDGAPTIEKQATLQTGDYFCKNSDNNWYIIPQEAAPDDNVIGVVFHAGIHETDNRTDYNTPLNENGPKIPEGVFHGYVVALTDANDGKKSSWGVELPDDKISLGISASKIAWNGYYNCLAIHNFAKTHEAFGMDKFHSVSYCEAYTPAAPAGTSGWFLPAIAQLYEISITSQNSSLKESIERSGGKPIGMDGDFYWSSTDAPAMYSYQICYLEHYNGYNIGEGYIRFNFLFRAILAF